MLFLFVLAVALLEGALVHGKPSICDYEDCSDLGADCIPHDCDCELPHSLADCDIPGRALHCDCDPHHPDCDLDSCEVVPPPPCACGRECTCGCQLGLPCTCDRDHVPDVCPLDSHPCVHPYHHRHLHHLDDCDGHGAYHIKKTIHSHEEHLTHAVPVVENHVGHKVVKVVRHVPVVQKITRPEVVVRTRHIPVLKNKLVHVPVTEKTIQNVVQSVVRHVPVVEKLIKPYSYQTVRNVPLTERRCKPIAAECVTQLPLRHRVLRAYASPLWADYLHSLGYARHSYPRAPDCAHCNAVPGPYLPPVHNPALPCTTAPCPFELPTPVCTPACLH